MFRFASACRSNVPWVAKDIGILGHELQGCEQVSLEGVRKACCNLLEGTVVFGRRARVAIANGASVLWVDRNILLKVGASLVRKE